MNDRADAPRFEWRPLNDETQVAVHDGSVVGVLYASRAWTDEREWWEFWWLPASDVSREEVLFGRTPAAEEWDTRWEAAQQAAQWIEARRTDPEQDKP